MKCKIKDIAKVTMGQSPESIWYNSNGEGIPFLQGNRTFGDKYPTFDTWTKKVTKIGEPYSVIMSVRAPVGDINIIKEKVCLGRGVCSIQMKNGNQEFLYYLLKYVVSDIKNRESGTVFGSINRKDIEDIDVEIPKEIKNQIRISTILKEIDDKIELNNKINKNLLEQALLVYKLFFVTGYDFNNKEQKDWSIGTIADISEKIICGKTPSTKIDEYYGVEIPFITIPDMHNNIYITHVERKLSKKGAETQKTKYLPKNSIMVSCIGTAGLVSITSELSQTNQQINSIIPKSNVPFSYIYLSMLAMGNLINKLGQSGTTLVNLNKEQFSKINILIPTNDVLKKFGEIVNPLFNSILLNQLQNEKLLKLRDSFLPKLMSGEIDVSKIDI